MLTVVPKPPGAKLLQSAPMFTSGEKPLDARREPTTWPEAISALNGMTAEVHVLPRNRHPWPVAQVELTRWAYSEEVRPASWVVLSACGALVTRRAFVALLAWAALAAFGTLSAWKARGTFPR